MAFITSAVAVRPSLSRPALTTSSFGRPVAAAKKSGSSSARITMGSVLPVFTKAMAEFKAEYPKFAERGWGVSVKAERWNGRHAMFGLFTLAVTAYCKGHGLLPPADQLLDVKQWGMLGMLGDTKGISMERAVILVAHIHVLFVSVAAAIAPFSFQDKLLLDSGEEDEAPAGLFPPFSPGMTKGAELWNSRLAMLGVICLVGQAVATKSDILDVLNLWLGKTLF